VERIDMDLFADFADSEKIDAAQRRNEEVQKLASHSSRISKFFCGSTRRT